VHANSEEGAVAVIPVIELKVEFPAIQSNPVQPTLSFSVTEDGKPIEIKPESKKKK